MHRLFEFVQAAVNGGARALKAATQAVLPTCTQPTREPRNFAPLPCCPPALLCRWFSGAQVGYVIASSCNVTTGDPVISVLSSTKPAGPFTCVGGNE